MGGENTALWKNLRVRLKRYGMLVRIESPISYGIPDVSYALAFVDTFTAKARVNKGQGWLELKHVPSVPKRPNTLVRYKYQPGQVEFLKNWWQLGGHAYVLAQVGRWYILHDGDRPALDGAGVNLNFDDLVKSARFAFKQPWGEADTTRIVEILTKNRIKR